ncbi:Rtf2 RING-finger-domain-containing protein [Mycotypha africana]|uniref:Rtf2 RING-finger-domain-containing protein n=1 Tax=Mycotypha africana TaxID=64632 RepID=UPI0023013F29|nr:Rtf2 RING-finger-domain-containing protein [Mycotypha africana]KAI8982399.1 Rtf2 RING-finger-domain-containing protein [Mycotypha africana]
MGNDGGSIPRRIELVKEKQRQVLLNPDLERIAAWFYCALSKVVLETPIVSDGLGKLYNQDAIIEYLIDKSVYGDADKICSHITSQKDVKLLNLTVNPAYSEKKINQESATVGSLDKDVKKMNGKHRFVYLDTCGCVFAEQALKEIPSKECVTCGKPFESENVIVINPPKEEQEKMRKIMEEKKAKAKAEKKAAKKNGESSKKRKRQHDTDDKATAAAAGLLSSKKIAKPTIQSSAATAVLDKVAQDLAAKKKSTILSSAVKSIYGSGKDKKEPAGNYLTKGTFTRY